tara:strand:- start:177 stop:332 length:156 start_codon:yes stop_codon:yes gene_type:complete
MNTETVVQGAKFASFLSHLKNNRLEYLVLLVLAHAVGITDRIFEQTSGVCL